MGGCKTRQASAKFHFTMRLYFNATLNFHISQDNNERYKGRLKRIWTRIAMLLDELKGVPNLPFRWWKKLPNFDERGVIYRDPRAGGEMR
jgi:hypothetical protein